MNDVQCVEMETSNKKNFSWRPAIAWRLLDCSMFVSSQEADDDKIKDLLITENYR